MIRAVIFDFNGVLVNDERVHFDLFQEVLGEEGVHITSQMYHDQYLGYDDRGCFEHALADAGQAADPARLDELIARKAARYFRAAEVGLTYYDGVPELIVRLAERYPLGIYSGALRPEIDWALGRIGVLDRFAAIISAEQTTRCKPDPQGYTMAFEALRDHPKLQLGDLDPGDCVVIEDSLAGLQAALGAGMCGVGVAQTYTIDELLGVGADAAVASTAEFTPEWIAATFNRATGA